MMRTHEILISMDSMMDTLIGSVASMSQGMAVKLLETGQYHSRRSNDLSLIIPYIDQVTIQSIFKNRDKAILQLSVPTGMLDLVAEMVDRYRENKGVVPDTSVITITLNYWPYDLTAAELVAFTDAIQIHTGADNVNHVTLPPKDMTIATLAHYNTVIWHELNDWADLHLRNIQDKGMVNTTLHCPEIIAKDLAQIDHIPPGAPGEELRFMLAEYMKFDIIPLSHYSLKQPE